MPNFLLDYQAVLVCLELIVNHLVYLFLEEISLFVIKCGIFFERSAESFLGDLEVVFDYNEGVLEYILEYLHLFFYSQELLFGVGIGCPNRYYLLFESRLNFDLHTMRFLIGSSLIIVNPKIII